MEESVKLPGSSFEEVIKIIQAYAQGNKAVPLSVISQRTGIHATTVSRSNGFLVSIGIIEGGKNKQITPYGKKLGDAISYNLQQEIKIIFRELVESTEFFKNLVGALRIRKGMEESAFKAHIAYSAGQTKSQTVMTGTGTILELLKRAGVVEVRDGKVVSVSGDADSSQPAPLDIAPPAPQKVTASGSDYDIPPLTLKNFPVININIDINISCDVQDMNLLGEKIKKLIDDVSTYDPQNDE